MKITLLGINYAPEVTGIAVYNTMLAEWLAARGHEVEVVTTFPYYPAWKKRPEDQKKLYEKEERSGVTVHRCWHYVPEKVSTPKRILHELSFIKHSLLRLLTMKRPDALFVASPPLLLGVSAWVYRLFRRVPYLFHVQDMQPDAAVRTGLMKEGMLSKLLYRIEKFAYQRADRVSGIAHGMLDAFKEKGLPAEKLIYFPNPVRLDKAGAGPAPGQFRELHGFAPDDFLAVYSGNLGVKQGLRILIAAAARLKNPRIRILICGDGAEKAQLIEQAKQDGADNITFMSLRPAEEYAQMLTDADVCLVTQLAGSGACFFPSKVLSIQAMSKPVLTVSDSSSELYRAQAEGEFGVNVEPGQPEALAKALEAMAADPTLLESMGKNGRKFVERFEVSTILAGFEGELERLAKERGKKHYNEH